MYLWTKVTENDYWFSVILWNVCRLLQCKWTAMSYNFLCLMKYTTRQYVINGKELSVFKLFFSLIIKQSINTTCDYWFFCDVWNVRDVVCCAECKWTAHRWERILIFCHRTASLKLCKYLVSQSKFYLPREHQISVIILDRKVL